ncbi:MAG: hypothetical protein SGARI_005586, partial [Bacillariaceae sp.]
QSERSHNESALNDRQDERKREAVSDLISIESDGSDDDFGGDAFAVSSNESDSIDEQQSDDQSEPNGGYRLDISTNESEGSEGMENERRSRREDSTGSGLDISTNGSEGTEN